MKRKIFNILIALVMVLGFSLIPAIAQGAVIGEPDAGYMLGKTGSNTATWSTTQKETGSYSALLTYVSGDNAYVEFTPVEGITVDDLADITTEWGYWYYFSTISGGPNMELRFTSPDYDPVTGAGHVDINVQVVTPAVANAWTNQLITSASVCYAYGNDPTDGTSFAVFDTIPAALSGVLDAIDATVAMTAAGDSAADWQLTRVRMEIGWGGAARTCYIDDVTINDDTYELEPIVMDAAYYHTGGTVNVTIYNGYASGTLAGYAYSDSTDPSSPITYSLTETSPDVFTGSFDLVGSSPGAGELLVNEGDTIYVKCTANWGAGPQTIDWGPTAIIDDTDPEITIVSPAVSENTSDNITPIEVTLTDDVSGINEDTILMTLDDEEVAAVYDADTGNLTYTSDELADGIHTVTVDVSDIAGNEATESWSFTVDTVAPVITDQVAAPPVVLPDEETEVIFTANVTDATPSSGILSVTANLTGVGGDVIDMLDDGDGDDAVEGDGIYTATADITPTTEDTYLLPVTATDEAGNAATENITLVVSSDIVPPVITDPGIEYPFGLSSAMPGDNVTISANVTDEGGMGTVTATCDAFAAPVDLLDADDDDIYTGTATVNETALKGEHTVTITATDAKGNDATDESLELNVVAGVTGYDLDLVEGWNLISLPLIPDDPDITAVISADNLASENVSNVGIIRAYDPETGFPYYIPETGDGELTEMHDGYGYWVFMNEDDTLTITGREWPAPPEVPPTYDVVVGWNLIGFKSLEDMIDYDEDTDSGYLLNIAGTYPVLWSFNAETGAYSNVKGVDDGMVIGHGFWLWAREAGTIVPPGLLPD